MQVHSGWATAASRVPHLDRASAWARESPQASGAAMAEHRMVTTAQYRRQALGTKAEQGMPSCVNATVDHPKAADPHTSVYRVTPEPERQQLPPCHETVLSGRQLSDLPFAFGMCGASLLKRVRLTAHGTVKCTRKRIRPLRRWA